MTHFLVRKPLIHAFVLEGGDIRGRCRALRSRAPTNTSDLHQHRLIRWIQAEAARSVGHLYAVQLELQSDYLIAVGMDDKVQNRVNICTCFAPAWVEQKDALVAELQQDNYWDVLAAHPPILLLRGNMQDISIEMTGGSCR